MIEHDTQAVRMITHDGEKYANLTDLARWAMLMQTIATDRALDDAAVWCAELVTEFELLAEDAA